MRTRAAMTACLLLPACANAPADLSALDTPNSQMGMIVMTAAITGASCSMQNSIVIGRQVEGGYKRVTDLALGSDWAPARGVQTSLEPGTYHIVGLNCLNDSISFTPGRREPGLIPFDPTYYDSLARFDVTPGDVLTLGELTVTLTDTGKFTVTVAPFDPEKLEQLKSQQPKASARLKPGTLTPAQQPVEGHCLIGQGRHPCTSAKPLAMRFGILR